MKSILMSIKPKWIEKIASGEKTVEVRKSVPKCGTPFKVYMYCTNPKLKTVQIIKKGESIYGDMLHTEETPLFIKTYSDADEALYSMFKSGKVVGEFVCDEVIEAIPDYEPYFKKYFNYNFFDEKGEILEDCLTDDEKADYANEQTLYGLHISDLKIYDKPKELSEFKKAGFMTEEEWLFNLYPNTHCHYEAWAKKFNLDRPPQSWQFVEEL